MSTERVELTRENVLSRVKDLSARLETSLKENTNFRNAVADQYWNTNRLIKFENNSKRYSLMIEDHAGGYRTTAFHEYDPESEKSQMIRLSTYPFKPYYEFLIASEDEHNKEVDSNEAFDSSVELIQSFETNKPA